MREDHTNIDVMCAHVLGLGQYINTYKYRLGRYHVAVLLSIYCDMYRIALHVLRYVSYWMTSVSSQPYHILTLIR